MIPFIFFCRNDHIGQDLSLPQIHPAGSKIEMCIRDSLYAEGDFDGIDKLEKELLAQNAQHKDWACTEELMKTTKDGKALYLHCLPADITGLSLSLIHI